jgi:hypothetical protein
LFGFDSKDNVVMNDIYKRELIGKELDYLRTELHDLKDCQIKFVAFAVTGTGFLFGITSIKDVPYSSLIPLLIIIPTWWIFFDKAKTISRIIGYYRILEYLYNDSENKYLEKFRGWENARTSYRKKEEEKKESLNQRIQNFLKHFRSSESRLDLKNKLIELITLQASSYWTISYGIFFGLSLVCILIFILKIRENSINTFSGQLLSGLFFVTLIISMVVNFLTLLRLIWGKYSYDANTRIWNESFKIPNLIPDLTSNSPK